MHFQGVALHSNYRIKQTMNNFIELKPLRNNIGAFIKTNLTEADNDIIKEIKNALDDFGVVFF